MIHYINKTDIDIDVDGLLRWRGAATKKESMPKIMGKFHS